MNVLRIVKLFVFVYSDDELMHMQSSMQHAMQRQTTIDAVAFYIYNTNAIHLGVTLKHYYIPVN
jgi:hypothetical protein